MKGLVKARPPVNLVRPAPVQSAREFPRRRHKQVPLNIFSIFCFDTTLAAVTATNRLELQPTSRPNSSPLF